MIADTATDIAFGADIVGYIASTVEVSVVDFVGALAVGSGCVVGGPAGCVAGAKAAAVIDVAVASWASPLGAVENLASLVSVGATVASDLATHNTGIDQATGVPTIGKDTLVTVRNTLAGQIPEANIDWLVSASQLNYDISRMNGSKPGGSIPLTNPGELLKQFFIDDWGGGDGLWAD